MKKHLVIVGTGHAHLTLLKQLQTITGKGYPVTAVNPTPWHYYSGMGPGLLSGIYQPQEARFNVMKMVLDRGGNFIEGKAVGIDPGKQELELDTGWKIPYDIITFNTGSHVPRNTLIHDHPCVYPVKPIENLLKARQDIETRSRQENPLHIIVAGGGPAGVEISANIRRLTRHMTDRVTIHLVAGRRLLSRFHDKVRRFALDSLTAAHIQVLEQVRLREIHPRSIELSTGAVLPADMVFLATGTRPSPLFRDSGIGVGADGGLLTDEYLQSVSHPGIFGGGDCISFGPSPLPRIGVHAVRQNPVLFHNIVSALTQHPDSPSYRPYIPQKKYLLILNMGDGTGIFFRNSWVWKGRLAFKLKHYIDTRFVNTYQV